jgi:hypothetical protein
MPKQLRLWVSGCCHVGTDQKHGRESLADAIRHSEQGGDEGGPAFEWDIALHLGDFSGNQNSPGDEEGRELVRQFGALSKHRREDFYCLAGNHDATLKDEPTQWWYQTYVDPEGKHSDVSGVDGSRRTWPIEGDWERYRFRVGNLLFLMMSDRNDVGPPVGRTENGGYPAGMVTGETFDWWKRNVEDPQETVIISAHHHMLKETTAASGPWEGFKKLPDGSYESFYHGFFEDGGPMGASYLYWLDDTPDAQAFEGYLDEHPGAIDLWLGGHTHTNPDDTTGGRSLIERKWDVNFVNCASLARHHVRWTTMPLSRLFTFEDGSQEVRVQCYLHTSDFAPQGWYPSAERTIHLNRSVQLP